MTAPVALPYYGGKSANGGNAAITRRILAELPMRDGYAEPFFGGGGVLFARRRARMEIVGDRDRRVANWWRCVRFRRDELHRLIRETPQSSFEFREARAVLDEAGADAEIPEHGDLRRALAFYIIVSGSTFHGPEQRTFATPMGPGGGRRPRPEVHRLADRLRDTVILDDDAVRILERLADRPNWAVYCDPPYGSGADVSPYGAEVDREALRDVLRRMKGAVILSGYPADGWDSLGWRRIEIETTTALASANRQARTECLWANFGPTARLFG